MPSPTSINYYAEQVLDEHVESLRQLFGSEVITFVGTLEDGVDNRIRALVEELARESACRKLVVLLTTTGGYVEVVERIVGTFRHNFDSVEFVIPDYAYSAGTVLALSGDVIRMDYYSRLGPIDPQIRSAGGKSVPAMGYLARYEQLIQRAKSGQITAAEVGMLLEFDQAELYYYDQAQKLSERLVMEWLEEYMFRHVAKAEDPCGDTAAADIRRKKAKHIANQLSDSNRWNSHGFGISMEVLKGMGLEIVDFGADKRISQAIRDYDALLNDYLEKQQLVSALHARGRLVHILHGHHHH